MKYSADIKYHTSDNTNSYSRILTNNPGNLRWSGTPTKRFDSGRPDFSPYGFTCELWAPSPMPRPDRHNEIEINLLHSGSLTYLPGGTRTSIRAGRMGIFWAGIPHQIVGWEGAEPYHVVTLPLGWFLASGLPAAFAEAVMRGVAVSAPTAVPAIEANFRQWEADLESARPVRERAALLEIHARLLRLAEALPEQSAAP